MSAKLNLRALACAAATLALAAAASPALGASTSKAIINDCQSNGKLTHSYTLSELQNALSTMPAYVKQYSNCYDVITQGILTVKHNKPTGPSGGGGSFLPTPVIVVLVVLILAGVTFGAIAIRQRRAGPGAAGPGEDLPPREGPPDGSPPV
jgi:hypothetical protein